MRVLSLLAPIVFAIHVAEEAPGFVGWFNTQVEPDITQDLFLTVNMFGFLITLVMSALLYARASGELIVVAWFSFLFAANAVLHITATIALGHYAPGTVTAAVLYIPFWIVLMFSLRRTRAVRWLPMVLTAAAAAAPMLIHGWLIIFEGSRLV